MRARNCEKLHRLIKHVKSKSKCIKIVSIFYIHNTIFKNVKFTTTMHLLCFIQMTKIKECVLVLT